MADEIAKEATFYPCQVCGRVFKHAGAKNGHQFACRKKFVLHRDAEHDKKQKERQVEIIVDVPICINGRTYYGKMTVSQEKANTLKTMISAHKQSMGRVDKFVDHGTKHLGHIPG